MSECTERNTGLDVIRCVALLFVISFHFFTRSDFLYEPVEGIRMVVMLFIRTSFLSCVPLFLLLSGYLLCAKLPSASYYLRIIRILFTYICASILFALYRIFIVKDGLNIFYSVLRILSFSVLEYAWYLEMYLGLFLLIPFLNILYHGLTTQKQKKWLILSMLFLTAGPSVLNIFRFDSIIWWLVPSISSDYHHLIPDWWTSLYPISYYFIGCYLKEYPLQLKQSTCAILLLSFICLSGSLSFLRSFSLPFVAGPWQEWGSAFTTAQSVLTFSLLINAP